MMEAVKLDIQPFCPRSARCMERCNRGSTKEYNCSLWSGTLCINIHSAKGRTNLKKCVHCGSPKIIRDTNFYKTKRQQSRSRVFLCLNCGFIFKIAPVRTTIPQILENQKGFKEVSPPPICQAKAEG